MVSEFPRSFAKAAAAALASLAAVACGDSAERETAVGEVVIEHVTRIGDPDGPGMIAGQVRLSKLRDGRYALFDQMLMGEVRFFGSDGRYLSTLGRRGPGPGEFEMPLFHFIESTGDTLFILDIAQGRLSAFSADATQLYDTRLAGGRPMYGSFLEKGWLISNEISMTPDGGVGLPLHVIRTDGKRVHSFGSDFPVHIAFNQLSYLRHTHIDDQGTLWAVPRVEYRLEKWRPTGDSIAPFALDTLFTPETVSFPPISEREEFARSVDGPPPSPQIRSVWREPGGPVWVILWLARHDWADRVDPNNRWVDPSRFSVRSFWRTRLEAVDPETGQVLLVKEFDDPLFFEFVGDGEVFSYGMTEDAIPYLDLWRVRSR